MARGVQLRELLNRLKAEIGTSQNVAHGLSHNEALEHTLRRVQRELWTQFDWAHLRVRRMVSVVPGTRFYPYPDGVTFEQINDVRMSWGPDWLPVAYGIEPEHLAAWNSDAGQRSFPIRRWQHDAANEQDNAFEVWPVPDQAGSLLITAKRALKPLVDPEDVCTLDGDLIVLYAAAELLAGQKSERAPIVLQKAQAHFRMLKAAGGSKKSEPFVIGGGGRGHRSGPRPGIDYVPSGYGKGG